MASRLTFQFRLQLLISILLGLSACCSDAQHASRPFPNGAGPKLPMPPDPPENRFDQALAERAASSPFGFKDPNMERMNVFSWYADYGSVMNDLGACWMEPAAIWCFSWNMVQTLDAEGSYSEFDWKRHDALIAYSQAYNLQITAKIIATQPAANSRGARVTPSLPSDMAAYRRFIEATVERYDGDGIADMPGLLYPIKRWKIEDEAMYAIFFDGSGADYAQLLAAGSQAIRKADPTATVIASMLYSTEGPLKDPVPDEFLKDFFNTLHTMGIKRPYDVIDQHWIVGDSTMTRKDRYHLLDDELDTIRKVAGDAGFDMAPFEILEAASPFVNEASQARDLIKQHLYAFSRGIQRFLWSGIAAAANPLNTSPSAEIFRQFTIIDGEGTRLLAYYSYKKMVQLLDGVDFSSVKLTKPGDDLYLCDMQKNGQGVWVMWNDGRETQNITLATATSATRLKVTKMVPQVDTGAEVGRFESAFDTWYVDVKNGTATLAVGATPLFVETRENE